MIARVYGPILMIGAGIMLATLIAIYLVAGIIRAISGSGQP